MALYPDMEEDRDLVLHWLGADCSTSEVFAGGPSSDSPHSNEAVAKQFIHFAEQGGFACLLEEIVQDGSSAFVAQWSHRGSSFVGFKQASPRSTAPDALLAGCAALLKNDWCRSRLPVSPDTSQLC